MTNFLRGTHHLATHLDTISQSDEALVECRQWFETAIELDPDFARAWGWLAYSQVTSWTEGWSGREVLDIAKKNATHAITLEPEDYDNYWALAYVYQAKGELDKALSAYVSALELNRNDPDMLVEMAETLCCVGQQEEALKQIERAMLMNPRFPEWYRWMFGWVLYHLRDYARSNETLENILRPNNEVRLILAANYAQLGNVKQAEAVLSRFRHERPDWTVEHERQTLSYRHDEDYEHWLDGVRKAGLPEG
jgi:adenylate cyclase